MNPLSTRPNRWRPITVFNLLVGLFISLSALGQTINKPGFYIVKGSFNWSEANADALQRGGHLATITSQSEQNAVAALVNGQPGDHFLLGATDSLSEGEWKWITGEPFVYKNWEAGAPNNQNNEDELYILNRSGNVWQDGNSAARTSGGYILEIEPEPYQPLFIKEGLVAHYPFNGNANDESGNGNNAGSFRSALDRFGGQTAKACETLNDVQPITVNQEGLFLKQHTFAAWVKFTSDSPAYQTIYNLVSGNVPTQASARLERIFEPASGNYYSLAISRRKWTAGNPATFIDLLNHSRPNPSPVQSNGVWYHIVVVENATKSVIGKSYVYVDGSLVLTTPEHLLTGVSDSNTIRLGGDGINNYANLNGALDDVRIYNRALSDTEVKALYAYESTPPDNSFITKGLVAYYPFNGNANDSIGNINGSVVGAALSADRFGEVNASYTFNGTGNRIEFDKPPIQSTENWTITAWVNPANFSQEGVAVQVGFDDGSSVQRSNGYGFGFSQNPAIVGIASGIHGFFSSGTSMASPNQWCHIIMLRDSVSTKFYINGVKSPTDAFMSYKSPSDFTIGSHNGLRWFAGQVDDVRVYNRPLSPGEAKALYDYESISPIQSPVFVSQPVSKTVNSGDNVVLSIGLQAAGTYNYQWQLNEQNIAGATASSLSVNNAVAGVYRYRVIVSNSAGTVISDTATLTVSTPPAPTIATQPAPKTVQEGSNVSLSVVAVGQGVIVYQWQFNEQNLPGATSATLNLNGVKLNTAGRYRVLVSSQYGVTISDTVTLTVNANPPPSIVTQPLSRTPAEGTQVSLTVTATGLGSLTYQWQVNNQNIPGATSSTLVLSAVRPSANGSYRVIVGNPYGTTISTEATVTVVVIDSDLDGLSDYEELLFGTNSNKADSDGDGLSDFAEVRTHGSNPLTTDTDGDGYSDGIEVVRDGNPNNRSVTPTGALAVFPAVDVEFYTLNGVKYQLEVSTDMVSWSAQGGVVVGTGGSQNHLVRASKATQFWRLKVVQ